jgi:hypothetical protein
MNPLSAAILTGVADDCKRHWNAGRFGRAPNRLTRKKFSVADLAERDRWQDYMSAYEDCLEATSTDHAPWYVVPADDKENARLIVSQVIVNVMSQLDMRYPMPDRARRRELQAIRKRLLK